MSWQAHRWASRDVAMPKCDPMAQLILCALAERADEKGRDAYPTVLSLAHDVSTNYDTARQALKRLEKFGLIVSEGMVRHNGTKRTNWTLCMDKVKPEGSFEAFAAQHTAGESERKRQQRKVSRSEVSGQTGPSNPSAGVPVTNTGNAVTDSGNAVPDSGFGTTGSPVRESRTQVSAVPDPQRGDSPPTTPPSTTPNTPPSNASGGEIRVAGQASLARRKNGHVPVDAFVGKDPRWIAQNMVKVWSAIVQKEGGSLPDSYTETWDVEGDVGVRVVHPVGSQVKAFFERDPSLVDDREYLDRLLKSVHAHAHDWASKCQEAA